MEVNSESSFSQICRTCLEEIASTSTFYHVDYLQHKSTFSIRKKLARYIPEVDLTITRETVICTDCYDAVNAMHKFKLKCLDTEIQLSKYFQQVHQTSEYINLAEMKEFYKLSTHFDMKIKTEELDLKEELNNEELTIISDFNILNKADEINRISIEPNLVLLPDDSQDVLLNSSDNYSDLTTSKLGDDAKKNLAAVNILNEHNYSLNSYLEENNIDTCMKIDTMKVPFKCSHCKYQTNRKCDLINHMRIHSHMKSFKCKQCKYASNWKISLRNHMRIHTEKPKPFKCLHCEYRSGKKIGLKKHMKIHTGEQKPFKCGYCKYQTHWKVDLKNHIIIHTSKKPFKFRIVNIEVFKKSHVNLFQHETF